MANGHGGKRKGSGRPKGSHDRIKRIVAPEIRNSLIGCVSPEKAGELVDILFNIANDESKPTADRIRATRELLDRGFGRPAQTQHVNVETGKDFSAKAALAMEKWEQEDE